MKKSELKVRRGYGSGILGKKAQFKIRRQENSLFKMKKGQFKIQQTAFMILAVTLFFVLAGLFYLSIYLRGVARGANEQNERRALINAEIFAESPEFTCGSHCIDTDRLMVLRNRTAFKDYWPFSSIEVRRVYPAGNGKECSLSNYPNCDTYTLVDKKVKNIVKVSNFVALCRKEDLEGVIARKCELGKIVLGVEVKNAG